MDRVVLVICLYSVCWFLVWFSLWWRYCCSRRAYLRHLDSLDDVVDEPLVFDGYLVGGPMDGYSFLLDRYPESLSVLVVGKHVRYRGFPGMHLYRRGFNGVYGYEGMGVVEGDCVRMDFELIED